MSVGFFNQLINSRNLRMGGLASGMDTAEVIQAMMSNSRQRLASQQAQRQITTWRMEAFRSVRDSMVNFNRNNLNVASAGSNAIRSDGFWNNFHTSSSNTSAVNVRPAQGATSGTFQIDQVVRLATNQTFTSRQFTNELTGGDITIDGSQNFVGQTLTIRMGSTEQTIALDSLTGRSDTPHPIDGRTFQQELQRLVDDAFGTRAVMMPNPAYPEYIPNPDYYAGGSYPATIPNPYHVHGAPAQIVNPDPASRVSAIQVNITAGTATGTSSISLYGFTSQVTIVSGTGMTGTAAGSLGFTTGQNNRANTGQTIGDFFDNHSNDYYGALVGDTFRFMINDVEIAARRGESIATVMNRINSSAAGVSVTFNQNTQQFTFASSTTGEGNNLRFQDIEGNLLNSWVGATSGNQFTSAATFPIIEQTGANVNTIISSLRTEFGGDFSTMSDIDWNNFWQALTNSTLTVNLNGGSSGRATPNLSFNPGGTNPTATQTANGMVAIPNRADLQTALADGNYDVFANALVNRINNQLVTSTGAPGNWPGSDAGLSVEIDGTGNFVFISENTTQQVSLINGATNTVGDQTFRNALTLLGFSPVTAHGNATEDTTLGEIGIEFGPGGYGYFSFGIGDNPRQNIQINEDTTLEDLINSINAISQAAGAGSVAGLPEGRLTINGGSLALGFGDVRTDPDDPDTATTNLTQALFGSHDIETQGVSAGFTAGMEAGRGQNAEIIVDGRVIISNSNTFTNVFGNTDIEVSAVTAPGGPPIILTVANDTDTTIENIRRFIEEYNAMVDYLHALVTTRPARENGQTFPPLTDEQRAEMSREEIEQWEERAREGLLFGDGTVRGILNALRCTRDDLATGMLAMVESVGLRLSDLGISTENTLTNSNAINNGRLEIFNEDRLRHMLEVNGDAVRAVFNAPDGLANRLYNVHSQTGIIRDATSTSSHRTGSLVVMAGAEGSPMRNQDATLVQRIGSIDRRISLQQERMEREFDRLWRRFSAMETAMARISAQSGWLEQFMMQNAGH